MIPPVPLQQTPGAQPSASVGHYTGFHQLLNVGSMMTIKVVTNLFTGEGPL